MKFRQSGQSVETCDRHAIISKSCIVGRQVHVLVWNLCGWQVADCLCAFVRALVLSFCGGPGFGFIGSWLGGVEWWKGSRIEQSLDVVFHDHQINLRGVLMNGESVVVYQEFLEVPRNTPLNMSHSMFCGCNRTKSTCHPRLSRTQSNSRSGICDRDQPRKLASLVLTQNTRHIQQLALEARAVGQTPLTQHTHATDATHTGRWCNTHTPHTSTTYLPPLLLFAASSQRSSYGCQTARIRAQERAGRRDCCLPTPMSAKPAWHGWPSTRCFGSVLPSRCTPVGKRLNLSLIWENRVSSKVTKLFLRK